MLLLGLDLGTQSLKAMVCDERLTVLGQHAVSYPLAYPAEQAAEQDPRDWERALGPAIAGALAAANAGAAAIAAIAIAGQLDGCIAVDAAGAPVHPALIWQDRRATAEAAQVAASDVLSHTGQVADASHMAPKIVWLRAHGVIAARFHQPVSYLVERLTGAAVIDPALASTTMLLDLTTARWSPPMLDAFAITSAELPALRGTCEVAGVLTAEGARLTGLRAGTPVAVGTGDDFANVLGAGVTTPGSIVCSIGTAEVVGSISPVIVLDRMAAEPMVETHVFPGGGYFIEHPGWLAGGAVRWAVQLLGLGSDAELDALAATIPAGAGGLTFLPALAGAMTPVWRPHARGTLHGLSASHTRAHVARAVLEGLTFASRDVVDRLIALGVPARDVLLLGGGARSRIWAQLRADALGLRHATAANVDTCPLGAAMIAAVAAGAHRDLASAAACAAPPSETFTPGSSDTVDALGAAYARYQALGRLLGDV
ncbi:xylulokinase [soil metagenome]